MLVRVMGMLNQFLVSARFGAGATMDAYLVASLTPVLVAQLLVSALENAVIPVYMRVRTNGSKAQTSVLFSTVLNILLFSSAVLTLLLFVFRRQMIFFSAPALDPVRSQLAIGITPVLLPVLFLTIMIGFLECILNAEGQFGWPAYAGMLVPLTTAILVLVLSQSQGVLALCYGMVLGLCLQLCVFIIRAKRAGLRYHPIIDWHIPELRTILLIAWPALFGSVISQISPLVDQVFASSLTTGSISAINYSLKLISIPSSVIAISVGRAAVPFLARQAAANDMNAFKNTLRLYLWAIGIGITLLSIGMLVLAHPLVRILFQHGQFSPDDTNRTAVTLAGFVVGLPATALVFILVRAFSALGKTRVLMVAGIFNVISNFILDAIFARFWQSMGIALATSVMYTCSLFLFLFVLRRGIGKLSLLTPPSELLKGLHDFRMWMHWQRSRFSPSGSFYRWRQYTLRVALTVAAFMAGVIGTFLNYVYTLRAAFGSLVILAFLRYPNILLLAWVLIAVLISSPIPIFNAGNFVSGLTIPTLILLPCMPVRETLQRARMLAFLLVFFLWIFLSIGISALSLTDFLTSWTIYFDYVAVAILAINILNTRSRIMRFIDAILGIATFVSLYGIYGYFTHQQGGTDPIVGFRIYSVFGASPPLALFLSIVLPLSLYRLYTLHGVKRVGGGLVVCIQLIAFGMTFARNAFVSFPLGLLIMTFFLPSRRMKFGVLCSFVAAGALLLLLIQISHIALFDRFFQSDITTLNGRLDIWQITLSHFDPTKLLGNGFHASSMLLVSLGVNATLGVVRTNYETHNLFIGILYDHGIIGLVLLITTFIVLFVTLIMGMRRTTGEQRMLFLTACAIFISAVIQSASVTDILTLGIGLYFWVIMALPFALGWSSANEPADQQMLDKDAVTLHAEV